MSTSPSSSRAKYVRHGRQHSLWSVLAIAALVGVLLLVAVPACIVGGLMQASRYTPPAPPRVVIENRILTGGTPTVVVTTR